MLPTSLLSVLVSALAASSATAKHGNPKRHAVVQDGENKVALVERGAQGPDHPDWEYLNAEAWWRLDPTQQDHARFHAYLSMAAYGDYKNLCPQTFVNGGFTLLQSFSAGGQKGYVAKVPEMKKIIIVFKGDGDSPNINWKPTSISKLVSGCSGCTTAKTVYDRYMAVKKATNDFAVAKKAVKDTGLLFSVTGHGIGGAVAALAGLDLGARNLVHYSHNSGAPRAFNYAAVVRYDNLFQVLAGQSLVHNNDAFVHIRPQSSSYYHVGQKAHITGDKCQWLVNCFGNNENSTCLGNGSSRSDSTYYFTPRGHCGSANKGF